MIQCLNNTLYTNAVVLRMKEQKVMIKKLGLALLTSAIASMSMASVESVQANLKKNYPNINVQNINSIADQIISMKFISVIARYKYTLIN